MISPLGEIKSRDTHHLTRGKVVDGYRDQIRQASDLIAPPILRVRRKSESVMSSNKPAKYPLDPLAVARAAGLDKCVELFPDDVIAAAQGAAQDRAELPAVEGAAEPWPPMRIRGAQ